MKKKRWLLIGAVLAALILIAVCIPTYALTAEEAEQQIATQGKEAVAGNVLIWFLCAVAFLKVSQKIDSFMSSLGINVGRTGGSMLAEAMIAGRAITKGFGGLAGSGSGGFRNSRNTAQENPLSGGLTGVVGRMFTENAAENVTGQSDNMTSHMARAVYEESLKNGGDFANNVISKVATGSVSQNGTLKGTEAADAFRSYMGLNQTTAETQSSNGDMQSSKVPVQPQENMADLTPQESDTLYDTDIPYDSNSFDTDNILSSNDHPADFEQGMNFPQTESVDIESDSIPSSQAIELNSESTFNGNGNYIEQADGNIMSQAGVNNIMANSVNTTTDSQISENVSATDICADTSFSQNHIAGNNETVETIENGNHGMNPTEQSSWLPDSPIVNGSATHMNAGEIETKLPDNFNIESPCSDISKAPSPDNLIGSMENSTAEGISVPTSSTSIPTVAQEPLQQSPAMQENTTQTSQASFSDMEIGGGRITGTEVSQSNPEGIRFAMYHTDQYARPEDTFNVVKAVDGSKWYHQYAKNVVVKEPHMGLDGKIIYNESITKKVICAATVVFLLPVMFLIMLPSVIFNDVTLDREIPILNDDVSLTQNMRDAELAVWTILKESHDNVIAQIDAEIADLGENETGIVKDDYASGNPINSATILSQYSASKSYAEINIEDLIKTVSRFQEQLFSYTVSEESYENEDGEVFTTYHYTVIYSGDSFFTDNIFCLDETAKETAIYFAENLITFMYGSIYDTGGSVAQVSPEVMQYAELIRKYAEIYGIPQYFDLICAVMMAESGGRVPDVMQSSECPYNTKYPNKPGAIDNPEYSIDCGVHYLADCLKGAGATSPADTGKISLALQGYNFGNGYIGWASKKYGGYSESNAIEFSNMMKEKLGWSNYGNPRYVQAVLKYLIPVGKGGFGSPFVGRNWLTAVSSEFGNRIDPINGKPGAFHDGLDIAYPIGTPMNAVRGGTVLVASDTGNGFGLHVVIDHGNGITTLYGHCSKLLVSKGQQVQTGQVIAEVGQTGRVTGPHLHLTFTINGQKKNPREYLDAPN